ncbi:MAG TPA: DNA topoisomerase 3 [Verrucomicrobiae bacterium]|nr:DNA topoisomerase 3 [Verrucomicrobiae bacterium]
MAKSLIITEKPSVAQDIAKALGGFKKTKEYYESDEYVLSWAVGHLFELAVPESMKDQDKWSLDKLPIMPPQFDLNPQEKTGSRVKVLTRLLAGKEITEVINACDAGREGELIFRYIMQYAGSQKTIRRLWLQSMTTDAIREAFERLRSDAEMQPLAEAARSRNEADWLVGINATRAFTLRLIGGKGSTVTSLGRVQTPTLAIIVDREKRIESFKPRDLCEVFANFRAEAGTYSGRWFDESFKKEESEWDRTRRLLDRLQIQVGNAEQRLSEGFGSLWEEHRAAVRLWYREMADAIAKKCAGRPGVVELEEKKPTTQAPPQLYDLTALQREGNNRFSFSARRTLQIAQALYEKHKAITYPRTDSRCLPEDYVGTVKKTLRNLGPLAAKVLENDWVKPNKRIFNNAKVSDHFAIIPTGNPPSDLDGDEQAIYDMVAKRFIAVFYPAAQFEVTTRVTRVEGEPFKTEGKIMVSPGWLEVYGKDAEKNGETNLPAVRTGEQVATEGIDIKEDKTNPPARYTEATILSAMESAGKLVEDEELAEAMKERGLGTPATRAQIIENLVGVRYLHRHGKELQPTAKAMQTIGLLKNVAPELVSPELTGEWEFKLHEIEHKRLSREQFMKETRDLTLHIVEEAKIFKPDEHVDDTPFGACPKCGKPLQERFKSFECSNEDCDFVLWKTVAGRMFSRAEVETLVKDRKLGPLSGFRSKANKRFNAIVKLNSECKVEFDFEATTAAATTEIKCEKCGKPMVVRSGRRGEFLACSGYPECKTTLNFKRDEAGKITPIPRAPQPQMPEVDIKCEKCGSAMVVKMSRRGPFLACSGYPKCKNAKTLPDEIKAKMPKAAPKPPPEMTDEKCGKCGAPMVKRRGRFGEFLGCSAYPKCKNIKKLASAAA